MTSIDPSIYLQNQHTKSTGSKTLGKDDFLKILMVQIQNQNPMEPMKDKEFIAQMAQFSSLEQMSNMAQSFKEFSQSQSLPPVIQYSHLIGKEISYQTYDVETEELGEMITGIVHSVNQKEGSTALELANGNLVSVDQVKKVSEAEELTETSQSEVKLNG